MIWVTWSSSSAELGVSVCAAVYYASYGVDHASKNKFLKINLIRENCKTVLNTFEKERC